MTDVWNASTPSANQRAGFAVWLVDANNGTGYNVEDVGRRDLDGLEHVGPPRRREFGGIGLAAATAVVLGFGLVRWRRSGRRSLPVDSREP